MKLLIEEINSKLLIIIDELKGRKEDLEDSLSLVQEKIDDKIEEAKGFKIGVDSAKEQIKVLEGEIESFEKDLEDITDKFSNKDLNAILETAHKEINGKIALRMAEINKCGDKINELTEKARMIKDLLISLKKDKEIKKNKLSDLTVALNYYETELTKIIDFSEENPDALIPIEEEEEVNFEFDNVVYDTKEVVDDTPVFDEIKSIEEDENNEDDEPSSFVLNYDDSDDEEEDNSLEENEDAVIDEENTDFDEEIKENAKNDFKLDLDLNFDNDDDMTIFDLVNQDEKEEKTENPTEEVTEDATEEPELDKEENDIVSLFEHDKTQQIDFKTLNDEIDKEYENIFKDSLTDFDNFIPSDEDFFNFDISHEKNIFDNDEEIKPFEDDSFMNVNPVNEEVKTEDTIEDFFAKNNLDFMKFSESERVELKNIFSKNKFQKIIDVLNRNNINLENIYSAAGLFDMPSNEFESMISKLLIAGQTTSNISLVLETLPLINNFDLNEVIESYGASVKDANIVDIIVKAKHLKDIGGAR